MIKELKVAEESVSDQVNFGDGLSYYPKNHPVNKDLLLDYVKRGKD